jgi:hypothetical protein
VENLKGPLISYQEPIIVTIKESEKSELSELGQVLLGAFGITGILVLGALLLGALMAGLMFWMRSRDGLRAAEPPSPQISEPSDTSESR